MNGFTQVLAKDNQGVLINACCPGWVSSDMGSVSPTLSLSRCDHTTILLNGPPRPRLAHRQAPKDSRYAGILSLDTRDRVADVSGITLNSTEEGARVPLNIALKDIGGTTGKYWANSSISGTGEGQVQKW